MRLTVRGPMGLVLLALLASACGASGSPATVASTVPTPATQASSPVSTSTPGLPSSVSSSPAAVASKGPASSDFNLTGSSGLTGPITATTILCSRPSLQGPQIFFLGNAGTTGPGIVIFLEAGHVEVRVATGSAAKLRLREFQGTGVTNFDAATGAQLDSTLTETTAPGTKTGNLGALTRISGSIDCGNQQPGSANLVISGPTPYGQLAGALTEVEVECTVSGADTYVGVVGLSMAGTTPVLVYATGSVGALQVTVETGSAATGYLAKGAGLTTLVPGGATMAGDVPEQVPAGASPSPNSLRVAGNATCGSAGSQ